MIKTPLSTVIGGAFWTPGATVIGGNTPALDQQIQKLFANGEQGFAYDPNDLSTMFQDAAGTVPVTAAGQPVGLMLDKSKSLDYGAERMTGGNFESGLIGTKTDGSSSVSTWTLNTVNPISGSQDGNLVITSTSTGFYPRISFPSVPKVIGALYEVSFNYKVNSGVAKIGLVFNGSGTNAVHANLTGSGTAKFRYTAAGAGASEVLYFSDSVCNIQIDNFSTKQVLGNHAYQTTSAARPILQQSPILGVNTLPNLDFTSYATKGVGTTTTTNSFKVVDSAGGVGLDQVFEVGKTYKVKVKSTTTASNLTLINAGSGATPVIASSSGGNIDTIWTATSSSLYLRTGVGTTTVAELEIKEVKGYRTDQNYLVFDGSDDFLVTNSIDFTATDEVSLFVGVHIPFGAPGNTYQIVAELSADTASNNGSFILSTPHASFGGSQYSSRGTTRSNNLISNLVTEQRVFTAKSKISSRLNDLRVNGGAYNNMTATQGTGKYGNYPLYIGRRGGTTLPFNGHIYGLIGIGRLTTDSETTALEKAIAKNTGVTLNV